MPILGYSNSAANINMSKVWTDGVQLFNCRLENIVGKGEIACFEQCLLFPHCFQKRSVVDVSK